MDSMRRTLSQKGNQMSRRLKATTAALVATMCAGTMAQAQGASCAKREMIIERLASKYGETRQSAGLNQNNGMVEVFASTETGTWTILVTMPTGLSCLMAAGKAWQGLADLEDLPEAGKGA